MMASVPTRRVGVASGVINLTRGLGMALGLSVTALVFDLAAGSEQTAHATSVGFAHALVFLGVIAAFAAVLSMFRRPFAEERSVV